MIHKARKRFGQNFLHDPRVIDQIVRAIAPREGDHLVEIGPGKGAITRELLTAVGAIDVVELDRDLIPILSRECGNLGELRVHSADALKFDFASLRRGDERLRVVGNLPYNISTPLIFHLLSYSGLVADMHFMLQQEVVDRLTAAPGGKEYGRLGIMAQYHCRAERLFTVPPGAFNPAPKVYSAVVRLTPHETPPVAVDDPQQFAQVVTKAFGQRRKTLRNNLKGVLSAEVIEGLGIDPGRRPETLSLEEFARLANSVTPPE